MRTNGVPRLFNKEIEGDPSLRALVWVSATGALKLSFNILWHIGTVLSSKAS